MNKILEIRNTGEICKNAFIYIGASTKRDDDSKIGYFGSGLKYAIATLIRNNIGIEIYSGQNKIEITKQKEMLRNIEFEAILIAGEKTSLTTDMGPDWEVWQAIREIYCNAIDEDGHHIKIVEDIVPEENTTKFFIHCTNEVQYMLDNWDDYFSNNRKDILINNKDCKIFNSKKEKINIYRKSVKCYNSDKQSLFDYDLDDIEINESRVIKYGWQLKEKIAILLGIYATSDMIRNIFDNLNSEHFEDSLEWTYCYSYNNAWLDIIAGRYLVHKNIAGHFTAEMQQQKCLILHTNLINSLKKFFGDKIKVLGQSSLLGKYYIIDANEKQKYLLKETLEFFKEVGLEITHPIKIAIFENKDMLGAAENSEIIISIETFDMGRKMLASTILEETLHIESGMKDETRGFQDYIINKIITILENKNGMFL